MLVDSTSISDILKNLNVQISFINTLGVFMFMK